MNTSLPHAWICERIVDDASVAIIYADGEGIIRLWNAGAEAIFGYTAEEAVGKSMAIIVPEKHYARHDEGYRRVMQTGVTKYGRDPLAVPAMRKDGSRISIEFNISIVRSAEGEVLGAAAVLQDVTARWEREKALRAKLAALEAKVSESQVRVQGTP